VGDRRCSASKTYMLGSNFGWLTTRIQERSHHCDRDGVNFRKEVKTNNLPLIIEAHSKDQEGIPGNKTRDKEE
jgi:hypothetical protein